MAASWWERLVYQVTYACATAWLDAVRDARRIDLEEPTDEDYARTARFRTAVERLQSGSTGTASGDSPPVEPSDGGEHRGDDT